MVTLYKAKMSIDSIQSDHQIKSYKPKIVGVSSSRTGYFWWLHPLNLYIVGLSSTSWELWYPTWPSSVTFDLYLICIWPRSCDKVKWRIDVMSSSSWIQRYRHRLSRVTGSTPIPSRKLSQMLWHPFCIHRKLTFSVSLYTSLDSASWAEFIDTTLLVLGPRGTKLYLGP
jgi:hypothetical protein